MKPNKDDGELQYRNYMTANIMLAKTRNLFFYAGRGTAKSTDVLAARSEDIIRELPGALFVFTSDTYMNLMTNVLPNIIMGWEERYDFFEGQHFVVDIEPPMAWKRPLSGRTFDYKHTISTYNGCKFFLTSLDRPSANAGLSVQHIFGDESKYLREKKLNKLFPTLRGNPAHFGHSPYFLGKTFVSDMANPMIGEDDWMLRQEENMDRPELVKSIQAGMVVNEIEWELYNAMRNEVGHRELRNIERRLQRWQDRHVKARWGDRGKGNTFFAMVSSYVNAEILTESYFDELLKTLDIEEFKIAVLSVRKSLAAGVRFYPKLSDRHFYSDGTDYTHIDNYGLRSGEIKDNSRYLRYCQHDKPLECGIDFGNQMSLVIGQEIRLGEYRIMKEFYTLPPQWIRELANKFLDYFQYHEHKVLYAFYDRAANANQKVKEDNATKFKNAIEKDRYGNPTGWEVQLMSIGQGNISHTEEYDLASVMMDETDKRLPSLLIDQFNCKNLKSSMELAPTKPGKGKEKIQKDKSSEKLPTHRLPMESTNFSDAFKYLICRKEWLNYCKQIQESDYTAKIY